MYSIQSHNKATGCYCNALQAPRLAFITRLLSSICYAAPRPGSITGCNTAATVTLHGTYGAVHLPALVMPAEAAAAAAAQQGMHLHLGERQLVCSGC
jgi:hypothetical protein